MDDAKSIDEKLPKLSAPSVEPDGESISLNLLLKLIKPFDGDRDKLNTFLSECERAFNLAKEVQKPVFFDYALTQLEGKAEAAVANHCFNTWEKLSNFLKVLYGDKKHYSHLLHCCWITAM